MPFGIGKNTTKRPPDGGVICAYAANNRAINDRPYKRKKKSAKNAPVSKETGAKKRTFYILPYSSVAVRIFFARASDAKPGRARQVQLALVRVPGWFMRPSRPTSR